MWVEEHTLQVMNFSGTTNKGCRALHNKWRSSSSSNLQSKLRTIDWTGVASSNKKSKPNTTETHTEHEKVKSHRIDGWSAKNWEQNSAKLRKQSREGVTTQDNASMKATRTRRLTTRHVNEKASWKRMRNARQVRTSLARHTVKLYSGYF